MGFWDWGAMVDRGWRWDVAAMRRARCKGSRVARARQGRRRECGRRTNAVRMDAARNQLLIAGAYQEIEVDGPLPAAWMRAISLDGDVAWEMRAEALTGEQIYNLGGLEEAEAGAETGDQSWDGRASPLYDAAIDRRGNMLLLAQLRDGLEYAWVGAAACTN